MQLYTLNLNKQIHFFLIYLTNHILNKERKSHREEYMQNGQNIFSCHLK